MPRLGYVPLHAVCMAAFLGQSAFIGGARVMGVFLTHLFGNKAESGANLSFSAISGGLAAQSLNFPTACAKGACDVSYKAGSMRVVGLFRTLYGFRNVFTGFRGLSQRFDHTVYLSVCTFFRHSTLFRLMGNFIEGFLRYVNIKIRGLEYAY